jgi:hypothetical protein
MDIFGIVGCVWITAFKTENMAFHNTAVRVCSLLLRPSSCSRGAGVLKVCHPFTYIRAISAGVALLM